MSRITVQLAPTAAFSYAAHIEPGALARAGEFLRPHLPHGGRLVVISTPPVVGYWGAALEAGLRAAGLEPSLLTMPDGEPHKTLAELERLADALVRLGAGRDTLIAAFGGGMVGDVAAFLASVYMRGVALVQIPTTLLAMVDSSLGGKTAVNLAGGKNLVGTFYHPRLILADPRVLSTLPEREYRSGLAEAIKYGVIRDRALFEWIEAQAAALERREPEPLRHLIAACLRHKAEIVAADEREDGLRRILNFGHTLGHALESATGYTYFLHGEAVAWGMIAAGELAVALGRFPTEEAERMSALIGRLCRPLPPITASPSETLRHAASDKKAVAGELRFVLPRSIGAVEVVAGVPAATVLAALARCREADRTSVN